MRSVNDRHCHTLVNGNLIKTYHRYMRTGVSMDELVAAWVKQSTTDQGKAEKLSDSGTVAQLVVLIRARRRARILDRSANRAMCDHQDDQADR
jgi:hypothetical protein